MITSLEMAGWEEHVTIYASTTAPQREGSAQRLRLRVPRIPAYFTGTGAGSGGAVVLGRVTECCVLLCWASQLMPAHESLLPGWYPGDLFTALLLAWLHRHPEDLRAALEAAVGGLQAVLADTVAHAGEAAAQSAERTAGVCHARELRLIQNVEGLRAPAVNFHAEVWS